MTRKLRERAVVTLALVALATSTWAGAIPSKSTEAPVVEADRARIEALLAREDVAAALAAHGLTAEEVEHRVAQLSQEDLSRLAANLDQIQAAGEVPQYIWILLAILIGVTIIVTVF